jgi:hypothetical protein
MTEIEKLQEQINSLQKQIDLMKIKESEVKPLGFGDLNKDDKYFLISKEDISEVYFEKDFYDFEKVLIGNAFRTEEDAESYRLKHTRKLEILEWLNRNRDFKNGTFFLMYHKKTDKITYYQDFNNVISNYPLDNPQEAIDLFGDDLKLIFDL